MLPNSATTLHPDEPMSESAFSELIRRDFGARITTDNSSLTLDEYERFMGTIRSSFSYRILRLMNTSEEALPVQPISPKNTLPQTNNHYLLDNIYTILQNNYLLSEKINQTDLIYGAAE